jgi:hypothetical protein
MHKPFEQLVLLVDLFYQENEQPVKRGAKPKYDNAFYLKLYFFGILNRCPEKIRFLERGEKEFPTLFKKNLHQARFYDDCH